MSAITFYRILTFILLPFAALLGLFDLLGLFAALANPPLLLGVFMLACVVIYVFASLSFLNKGLDGNHSCKPSLRDWIRVNAFVSTAFAVLSLMQCVTLLANPALFKQTTDQVIKQQGGMQGITPAMVTNILKGIVYFIVIFCSLLLAHILLGFRLLRSHCYVFEKHDNLP